MKVGNEVVQVSPRGQITLPQHVRKELGLEPGDALLVSLVDGRIVLQPASVLPIETYSEERIREFDAAAKVTPAELAKIDKRWGLRR
ncbi:MAG: AbrB/MazE/SpoVT family DNA-binding domain-containing protein [Deltaproteobacteria bacterium]|nr:AbrB/MazE/SpoVT family DNA-binding domain-containing protein [Deltaproteobacteria bacterium]